MTTLNRTTVCTPTAEQTLDLQAWRSIALEKMPYMATMLFSLRCLNAPGLGTFAVDNFHRLYIDFDKVTEKGVRWCAEALLHECGHLFGDHTERAMDAAVSDHEHKDWNYATDAEINDDLRDAGCDMSDAILPETLKQADYQTAETYMKALRQARKNQPPQPQGQQGQQGQGQGQGQGGQGGQQSQSGQQGQGQPGQGQGGQPQQGQGQGSGQGGPDQAPTFKGCGSGSGGLPAPCELPANNDLGGAAPAASAVEKDLVNTATATEIRNEHASGRGTVPAGLVERANIILKPSKLPWRSVLNSAVKRAIAKKLGDFDMTYTRRNRRRHGGRIIFPGTESPQPSLAVVRDTSGSMGGNELNQVTIEIDAIARKVGVRGKDLRVLDVDAAVHETVEYRNVQQLEKVTGRGGTDMRVGIEAATKLRPRANAVVVISDGGTPWPTERLSVPLVICLVGPDAEACKNDTPTWARTVVVDDL